MTRKGSRWGPACLALLCACGEAVAQVSGPGIIERAVEAPGPDGPLAGTALDSSDPRAPVVLIVPGSGPTDRDGNNPLGVRAAPYRLIAEGLAARGIRSVRIDKRGAFGSSRAVPDGNAVTIADYAADVHSWAASIRDGMGASCVWVLGHSEGGLVALAAAQRPADICGLLLVAAPGRRLADVLRAQLRANPANAPILEQAEAVIARLEAGQRVDEQDIHPGLLPLFRPAVQGFMISLLALDPAELIAAYGGRVLILQGLRDLQVARTDAERLHEARPDAKLVLLPEANHVLKAVASDDRAANTASYRDPDRPLAAGVIDALAAFVLASGRKR